MFHAFLSTDACIRLSFFVGMLVVMAIWEIVAPRRSLTVRKPLRWLSNLALVMLNSMVLRVLVPLGVAGVALAAESHGWGAFNIVSLPSWLAVLICVVALDFVIYVQHVMFHAIPALWRLHMVHHADMDIDVTTGARFHPIEILLSFGIKAAAIVLLGAPPLAVLIFEVGLNATAMFNHGNVRLPLGLDRLLRCVVVTPDMHRVHHSVIQRETNSNFGFNLPWWDFLLGTYQGQPARGHEKMTVGLSQLRDERVERLDWMLAMPFIANPGDYPLNRADGAAASKAETSQTATSERFVEGEEGSASHPSLRRSREPRVAR